MKQNTYRDTIHNMYAVASSSMMAWMLIRGECHKKGIEIPTADKIILVKEDSGYKTTNTTS